MPRPPAQPAVAAGRSPRRSARNLYRLWGSELPRAGDHPERASPLNGQVVGQLGEDLVGKQGSDAQWVEYDPSWLVELAGEQEPSLVSSQMKCTTALVESKAYIHFVNPASPNQPGSEWQFDRSVLLNHPKHGTVVVDVLRDGRIGGVEFLKRL